MDSIHFYALPPFVDSHREVIKEGFSSFQ